jgi:[protein-PII] uridylyltransferase
VSVHTAKINTLGDRAEDVFLISGEVLSRPKQVLQLEQQLLRELGLNPPAAAPVPETVPR